MNAQFSKQIFHLKLLNKCEHLLVFLFLYLEIAKNDLRASSTRSHLFNTNFNLLKTPLDWEKIRYLLVTDNYIRIVSLRQLTSHAIKIENKSIHKSWSHYVKFNWFLFFSICFYLFSKCTFYCTPSVSQWMSFKVFAQILRNNDYIFYYIVK